MTWMKWLPWRFAIRYVARKHGFLDPVALLARLHQFAQPSEVGEPIELLRAGVVFHARGLINSRVIQHNLDWVWPFWIERQFDPRDPSFVPRAFSITHINLTHRNWTAIGYPDVEELPIVDPRGLLTPFLDGWSLDGWLLAGDGRCLLPSRTPACRQQQQLTPGLSISTESAMAGLQLTTRARVVLDAGQPVCQLTLNGRAASDGWLVLALRPQNPEGISFVHQVSLAPERDAWLIDGVHRVTFDTPVVRHHVSDYRAGDVYIHLLEREEQTQGLCDVGMVTAAAMFPVKAGQAREIRVSIPLADRSEKAYPHAAWPALRAKQCQLRCPEAHYQFLYDAAITSLILHSPEDVYPGPFTYKRFWFRDAAFLIHALLCAGFTERAERALAQFPARQTATGFFRSQEGEWDSNGQVLWILERFFAMTGKTPSPNWLKCIKRGARWIERKRIRNAPDAPHAGLLPAGFSAEHLGPNDYYYWDDFWGVAGLRAAARLLGEQDPEASETFAKGADDFAAAIERSLAGCEIRLGRPAMPASPYRRLDAGAIGSLAVGYPIQGCAPTDRRLLDTVEFLLKHCFVNGAFYQDMIHSGLNAYLTLHVAQVLLRAGDSRYLDLMDSVAELASPTGQWPEAIHPLTGGGCMGDGHHVWASAEWVLMVRHCFVREEGGQLILCEGIPARWLEQEQPIHFGPAPTAFGAVTLSLWPNPGAQPRVEWQGDWHREAPDIVLALPGYERVHVSAERNACVLRRTVKEDAER